MDADAESANRRIALHPPPQNADTTGSHAHRSRCAPERFPVKAIRCQQGSVLLDPNAQEPTPKPGEALIEPTRLAIDADDARAADREFSGVLGHEFVGTVAKLHLPKDHPARQRLLGKRVVGSAHVPCGECDRCKSGMSLHCAHATTLGLEARDGCFAQRFVLPVANLVCLPDSLDDDRAIFANALGRVLHAAQMLRLEGKAFVSVLGDGPAALLAAQVMATRNASVRLLGTHEANLELCTKWGVKHRPWHQVGRRHDQNIVFDCAGTPESIDLALGLIRPRGMVVLMRTVGGVATLSSGAGATPALDTAAIIRDEVQVLGSRGCAIADAVAELAAGRVDVLNLVARRLRFDDGPQAVMAAKDPGTLKILLDAA